MIQEQGDRRYLVSDLVIINRTQIIPLEQTGGGRACMRTAIHKAKAAPHKTFALVVDWETPPKSPIQKAQQYRLRYIACSENKEALEIWEEEGTPSNIAVFSLR